MDSRLRQLVRDFQSAPDVIGAQTLIRAVERSGAMPPPVQELLSLVTNQTGLPSLYFVCGAFDENDTLEAGRINWLRTNFTEHRYLWFIICRNLLDFVAHHLLQPDLQAELEILLKYPLGKRKKNYPEHQSNNGQAEYQLLRRDVMAALALLQKVGPRTGSLSTPILEAQISLWERWSALTADEGFVAMNDNADWNQFNNSQSSVYNLVETFHHIFLALAGQTGEPHLIADEDGDNTDNDAYTGSPFLKHWHKEHGSLNPGHHVNLGETTRLNELVMSDGKIDWFVVFSNCLVGCYFTYIWTLRARGQEFVSDALQQRTALSAQYDTLEKQSKELLSNILTEHPTYRSLQLRLFLLRKKGVSTSAQQGQMTRVINQMDVIEDQARESHADLQALEDRLVETADLLDETREAAEQDREVIYERRFWQDTQPVYYISIAEYLNVS
jgi:hypothetical protein